MLWLERPGDIHADILRLLLGQRRQLTAERLNVNAGDHLVQDLRQAINVVAILIRLRKQFDLCNRLIGKGVGHHERWVAGSITQVQQATFTQYHDGYRLAVGAGEGELVNLRLNVHAANVLAVQQAGHVDLVIEVADVAQHRVVLHHLHVLKRDNPEVPRRGDDNVGVTNKVLYLHYLEAVHERLQGVDRIDLGDLNDRTLARQRFGTALTYVTVAAQQDGLAADQHVGSAVDAIDQRVAGAVAVVELGLRHGIIDVHRREWQHAFLGEVVEAVHARRCFFGDTFDAL